MHRKIFYELNLKFVISFVNAEMRTLFLSKFLKSLNKEDIFERSKAYRSNLINKCLILKKSSIKDIQAKTAFFEPFLYLRLRLQR